MGKLLSREQLNSLKPQERSRYVQNLILHTLSKHDDLTISELMDKANISRITATKHLDSLVYSQQVMKRERAMGSIKMGFYKLAVPVGRVENIRSELDDSVSFSFFVLKNDDNQSIVIQQKKLDESKNSQVRGAIIIPFEDMKSFISSLNAYSNRVMQK